MNAPPTPPLEPSEIPEVELVEPPAAEAEAPPAVDPTPAAEVQAEQPPQSPAPTPVVPADNTIYHNVFPTLVSLAVDGNYRELIHRAKFYDSESSEDKDEARFLLVTPLVLSYLILDDLPPARYTLTRLHSPLFNHPLSQALFSLLSATWERNHAEVYARSNVLLNLVNDAQNLSGMIPSMISTFLDSFRSRTFNLISKAYTSLTLAQAETYLGLSKEQLLSIAAERGWQYDVTQEILKPVRPSTTTQQVRGSVQTAPSSLVTFDLVADGVALLES